MGEQEHVLHSHGLRAVALSFVRAGVCFLWTLRRAICENWSELCKKGDMHDRSACALASAGGAGLHPKLAKRTKLGAKLLEIDAAVSAATLEV